LAAFEGEADISQPLPNHRNSRRVPISTFPTRWREGDDLLEVIRLARKQTISYGRYSTGESMQVKREAVERLRYPG
jgi:hypothetical protein